MKEIIEVPVQGFCGGVSRALDIALKTAQEASDGPVYVLGSLVHNRFVNESLKKKGLRILEAEKMTRLDLLDEIEEGTVIFTAHGVSAQVRSKAAAKKLKVVDASCPFVLSTRRLIEKKLEEGAQILYCGKKGHPEAEGALSGDPRIFLIQTAQDLPQNLKGPLFVTNQTTMSMLDLEALFEAIRRKYPQAEFCNEICSATRIRQQAVMDLNGQNIDLLVVVGDPASNNTARLSQAGGAAGIPRILQVEEAADLEKYQRALSEAQKIAVTSGASTPSCLKDDVIRALKKAA